MRLLLCSAGLGALQPWLSSALPPAPRVAFVDVAAQPLGSPPFVERCRNELTQAGCTVMDLDLTRAGPREVERRLTDESEAVFVTGGYAIHLLEWARRSGFVDAVDDPVRSGALAYVGVSAGAALAGPSMEPLVAPDDPGRVDDYAALGLVDFVVVPHVDRYAPEVFEQRRRAFAARFSLRRLEDNRALVVTNGQVVEQPSP